MRFQEKGLYLHYPKINMNMFCIFTICRLWCGYRKRPGRLILSVRTPYDGFFILKINMPTIEQGTPVPAASVVSDGVKQSLFARIGRKLSPCRCIRQHGFYLPCPRQQAARLVALCFLPNVRLYAESQERDTPCCGVHRGAGTYRNVQS